MNLRRFFSVLALVLAWTGCSSGSDMDNWVCSCQASLTFALPRPLAGVPIEIAVQGPSGNVESLACQANAGVLACLPLSSRLVPNFDASGALQSVTLDPADQGTYTVELRVDGAAMGGGTFNYEPSTMTDYGPCGAEGTTTCLTPQTFALVP
jgi:hypothetical protein